MNTPRVIQIGILLLFAGEFIAMSFGCSIVPKDPETKLYFYTLQSVFLTILSVPTLAALIQSSSKDDELNKKSENFLNKILKIIRRQL